jgi:hypothetical protein
MRRFRIRIAQALVYHTDVDVDRRRLLTRASTIPSAGLGECPHAGRGPSPIQAQKEKGQRQSRARRHAQDVPSQNHHLWSQYLARQHPTTTIDYQRKLWPWRGAIATRTRRCSGSCRVAWSGSPPATRSPKTACGGSTPGGSTTGVWSRLRGLASGISASGSRKRKPACSGRLSSVR